MKGVERLKIKIDKFGRIIIPKNVREKYNFKDGEVLNIRLDFNEIVIYKNKKKDYKSKCEEILKLLKSNEIFDKEKIVEIIIK